VTGLRSHLEVADIIRLVPEGAAVLGKAPREIRIDEKAHGGLFLKSTRERVVLLFIDELLRVLERCADVVGGDVEIPLDLLETHAAGDAADDPQDGHARVADHGPAVLDAGVDGDPVALLHGILGIIVFASGGGGEGGSLQYFFKLRDLCSFSATSAFMP
jgi:hypothetical protein